MPPAQFARHSHPIRQRRLSRRQGSRGVPSHHRRRHRHGDAIGLDGGRLSRTVRALGQCGEGRGGQLLFQRLAPPFTTRIRLASILSALAASPHSAALMRQDKTAPGSTDSNPRPMTASSRCWRPWPRPVRSRQTPRLGSAVCCTARHGLYDRRTSSCCRRPCCRPARRQTFHMKHGGGAV